MRDIVQKYIENLYPEYAQKSLNTPIHKNAAYPVVDQFFFGYFNKGEISTWTREDRFAKEVITKQTFDPRLDNAKTNKYIAVSRKFEPQNDGKIRLQTVIDLKNADNGARFYLSNTDEEKVFEVVSEKGFFFVVADGKTETNIAVHDGFTYFRADFDLDAKTAALYIDGVLPAISELPKTTKTLAE